MLLPAPDTSSLPLDGSFTPDILNTSDIADPSGATAAGSSGWSATLQSILAGTVAAADKTFLPGTPVAGVPAPHPPITAGVVSPSVSGVSSTWSMSTLLLVAGLILLLVVLVVAMKKRSA